jgi:predicted RNA-binding Zn-ribbon protein involved in translation (DUF1610 family)
MSQMDHAAPPPPSPRHQRQFPCKDCGADLVFEPGTNCLKCPYCGSENCIPDDPTATVREEDYLATLNNLANAADTVDTMTVKCVGCGAESQFNANVVASKCPFCGTAIVNTAESKRLIKPRALLPFHVTRDQATRAFRDWVSSLWLAPNELAKMAERAGIDGVYTPAWTYDAQTYSRYTGQRGDDYWDTETYTDRDANGNTVTRTRQVRRTRWHFVSGQVANPFDDVLVLASHSLPRKLAESLEPWDLKNMVPYRDEYLSGFVAESYQVDLPQGFEVAKGIMDGYIRQSICQDIGGDHQRIDSVDTRYANVTFKHALLPVWISAYRYREKTYRILVNARTGEVQGERPWSWVKILLLVIGILMVVAGIAIIVNSRH